MQLVLTHDANLTSKEDYMVCHTCRNELRDAHVWQVAKNIVLAGVGTVALRDGTPVASAASGNFLVDAAAREAGTGR